MLRTMQKHEITADRRMMVSALTAFGAPQPFIASKLGITDRSLRRLYRAEIDEGTVDAVMRVARTMFEMATSGRSATASIFFLRTRGGPAWRIGAPLALIEREPSLGKKALAVLDAETAGLDSEWGDDLLIDIDINRSP